MLGNRDDDLKREIHAHLELEAEERVVDGMSPDEARYAARRAFGSVMRVTEDARSVWIAPWIEHALQDLRHAARRLRRAPAFAITAIGILTAGIALNLAPFQLLNAAALRPLPVADLDTLVRFDRVAKRFRSNGIPFPARNDRGAGAHSASGVRAGRDPATVLRSRSLSRTERPRRAPDDRSTCRWLDTPRACRGMRKSQQLGAVA